MSKDYLWLFTDEFQNVRGEFETHDVFDAGLKGGAKLHRFKNSSGVEYSAIYIGNVEQAYHYRSKEEGMIEWWNDGTWKIYLKHD